MFSADRKLSVQLQEVHHGHLNQLYLILARLRVNRILINGSEVPCLMRDRIPVPLHHPIQVHRFYTSGRSHLCHHPKVSISAARSAPILDEPMTRTPFFIAVRISRWATALSWWKTPSINPIMVALSFTAASRSHALREVDSVQEGSSLPLLFQDLARERR